MNNGYSRLQSINRFLYTMLTVFLIMPMFGAAITAFVPNAQTVVHADPNSSSSDRYSGLRDSTSSVSGDAAKTQDSVNKANSKASNSDSKAANSDSSSSSSASDQDSSDSEWNTAVKTLSGTVSGTDDGGGGGGDGETDQAKYSTIISSQSAYINIWGFMGPSNNMVWTQNDNSSWASSYEALMPAMHGHSSSTANTQLKDAYQVAARFAYAMQSQGLDKPVKSGFGKISALQVSLGWLLQISYYVLTFADYAFNILVTLLQDINPLHWVIAGSQQYSSGQGSGLKWIDDNGGGVNTILKPFADTISTYYDWFTGWGWAIMTLFFVGAIGMAALGITVGQSGGFTGQGRAVASSFVSYFKRLFVWVAAPVFAASIWDMATGSLANTFASTKSSVAAYAVYGAFDDYHNWVIHSRLSIPHDLAMSGIASSFNGSANAPLSHKDIVLINYLAAGDGDAGSLYQRLNNTASKTGLYDSDSLNSTFDTNNTIAGDTSTNLNSDSAIIGSDNGNSPADLLKYWTNGSKMTAADYGSLVSSQLSLHGSQDLSQVLTQKRYNIDGMNQYIGSLNVNSVSNDRLSVITRANYDLGDLSSTDVIPGNAGGLSTLGMYNYMLTTASDSGMTISNTENLADDVSLPQHYNVNLVGTGLTATGNAVWALGLMGGLAIIVGGYAFAIFKSIIHGLPAMVFALFHTAFASIKGGVQLISVVTGMLLGTLGTAFMYRFAQVAFIALAQYSDDLLSRRATVSAISNIFDIGAHGTTSGSLDIPAFNGSSYVLVVGALNILYGLFLLFLAFMLLRYRGIVIDAMSSVVEETVNKIMASFGTLTGGSAGTRGGISQNTDSQSSNTWSAGASSLISRGGMGALMTAGGAGGLAALGKGAGKANASKGVGAAGKGHSLGKNGDAAKKAAGQGTSAAKKGNAAGATGTGKAGGKGTGTNAASALGQQNSQRNGTGAASKGLSGASQHAPAGQGAGHGTNGAHGATAGGMIGATQGAQGQSQGQGQHQGIGETGQTNGMGQDQSQGQQAGDNGVGNAAGGDMTNLSTNMNDTNQQNSDLSSIGGDNGVNTQNSDMSNSSQIGDSQSLGGDVSNNSGDMRTLGQDDGSLQGGLDGSGQGVNGSSNNSSIGGSNVGGTNLGGTNTNSSNLQNLSTNGGSNNMNDLTNSSTQLGNGGLGQNGMGSTNSNLNNSENNQNGAHNNTNSQLGQTGANDNNNLSNSFGGSQYTDNDGNTQLGNDTTNTAGGADTGAAGNLGGSDVTTNSSNLGDINNSDQSVDNGGSFNTNSDTNNATNNDMNQAGAGGINESNNSNLNSTTGGIQNMNQNGVGAANANGGSTMGTTGNGGVSENNNSNLTSTTGGIQNMSQNGLGNANATGGNATGVAGATGDANANANGQIGGGNSTTIGGDSALTNTSSQFGGSNLQGDSLNTSQNSNLSNGGVNANSQIGGANNNTNSNNNSTDGGFNNSINSNSNLSDGGINNSSQFGGNNANTNVGGTGGNTTSTGGNSTNTGGTSINGMESTNLTNGLGGGDSSTIGGSQSIGGANNNSTTLGGSNMNGVENTMNNTGGNMSSQMGDSNNTNMGANNSSMNGLENNNVTNGLGNSTSSIGGDSSNTNIGAGNELNNNNSQINGNNNANALGGNTNVGNSSNLTGNVANSNLNGDVNNSSQIGGDTSSLNTVGDTNTGTQALNGQDGTSIGGQDGVSISGQDGVSQTATSVNGVDTGSTIGNGFSGTTGGEVNQGSTGVNSGTGDANNNFATQTNDAGVSNVAGGLGGNVPVNNSITPQGIQSQMSGVQAAQNNAQQAQTLAQQNPDNQVLQQRADTAGQQLSSVQGSALTAYNSQPVSADTAQASWVSPDANQSQMSIGNVNTAMNNVYSAQQDLTSAQTQFGANSPQVQGAQTALNTARQGAVKSGLSEQVVSNPKAVASAHASINSTTNSLKTGNWRPTGHPGGGVSGGSANKGGQRSIGI